jgi:hypothetical protein
MTDERTPFERDLIEILRSDVEHAPTTGCHPSLDVLLDCECGELPRRERAQVLGHCARCPVCRGRRAEIAASLQARLGALCGRAPSWSFAAWHARSVGAVLPQPHVARWGRVAAAWAGAAAVVCLGLAVRELLEPTSNLVKRSAAAHGPSAAAIGLFAAAGLLTAFVVLWLILKWRKR